MKFQVRVSEKAEKDVDAIFLWLARHSEAGASRWYEAYLDSLRALTNSAPGWGVAPESDRLGIDLRQVLFKTRKGRTYRSVFILESDSVQILAVRGPGQDIASPNDLDISD